MPNLEHRLDTLEKQKVAVARSLVIIYDAKIGPPARQPHWPPVVVLIPRNGRDDETVKTGA